MQIWKQILHWNAEMCGVPKPCTEQCTKCLTFL